MKKVLVLLLGCSQLFLSSCRNLHYYHPQAQTRSESVDTSVNQFVLRDTMTVPQKIGRNYEIHDDYDKGEGIWLTNDMCSEFLFLKRENGGLEHQFDYCYLTNEKPAIDTSEMIRLSDTLFQTSFGARLGLSEHEFANKYKDVVFSIFTKEEGTTYLYADSLNLYKTVYVFVDGKLAQIEFGYIW